MNLSQKCQYAVRAILELAKQHGQGPVAISLIASNQAVPQRFLENILNELRPAGIIESRRGIKGGYMLSRSPRDITVGEVVRLIEGPLDIVKCTADSNNFPCPLKENCALVNLWTRAKQAVEKVYDSTTFADLVKQEKNLTRPKVLDYCI